jgi:EpsI family protein
MILGDEVAAKLVFPLCYLLFAVPFGDFLIPALQDFTALFAVKALQMSSIPVYLEGRNFYIPSGSFKVEEGCSGVRYLIASISLGTLYAYLFYSSYIRRILFVVFSAIVPILANAVRAYGIVMIAHYSDYKIAVGVDHIIYGWIFFGIVITLMFWIGSFFQDAKHENEEIELQPNQKRNHKSSNYTPITVSAMLLMVISSLLATFVYSSPVDKKVYNFDFPRTQLGWEGPFEVKSNWYPVFRGATQEKIMQYRSRNRQVEVYIGYYSQQKQGTELINSQNRLFDEHWKSVGMDTVRVEIPGGGEWDLKEFNITSNGENRIVWYWYTVGGYFTTNAIAAKLFELPSRLKREENGAAIFAVSASYELDGNIARQSLERYLDSMFAPLMESVK